MSDTTAASVTNGQPVDGHARPQGCFYHSALYFNRNTRSPTGCTGTISCLCRAAGVVVKAGNNLDSVFFQFISAFGQNLHISKHLIDFDQNPFNL